MLRLFFENKELELNESVQVAITKQFEDVTNPTSIINDWSKTVKIPNTSHNNKIFGHIYNIDRLIVDGDYKLMGVYFNQYKKIDFRLQWGDAIVMTGYAKNISVDKDGYSITLNGELGKIFQEMKKITFDTTTEYTDYLIDGAKYVSETITKDLVYDLWCNSAGLNTTLYTREEQDYRLEDIIGFAPNNNYSKDFDYKTFQMKNSNTSKKFSEVLDRQAELMLGEGKTYVDATGIAADTIIGDGLLPREIGEYRSYLQQPYIFFNKLFQIFTTKTEEITGYKSELHPSWFNDENPYWTNLVYMLSGIFDNIDSSARNTEKTISKYRLQALQKNGGGYREVAYATIQQTDFSNEYSTYNFSFSTPLSIYVGNINDTNQYNLRKEAGIEIYFKLLDNDGQYKLFKYLIRREGSDFTGSNDYVTIFDLPNSVGKILKVPNFIVSSNVLCNTTIQWGWRFIGNFGTDSNGNLLNTFFENLSSNSYIGGGLIKCAIGDIDSFSTLGIDYSTIDNIVIQEFKNTVRSLSNFTLNQLWNKEYNLFDEILNYCKQFRIGVFCDNIGKSLIFIPLSEYFKNYSIKDWTEKIDYSRDYHIEPITFHNKYILFNYDKYNTNLNEIYNEKYGLNYGEYKLSTDYEFNNDVNSLFKFGKISIPSTDTILSWGNLYDNLTVIYTIPNEITIDAKDKDNKSMSIFGSFLFYKGLQRFDTTNGLRSAKITDDTKLQTMNQTYFYTQDGDSRYIVGVNTCPIFDINYSDNICTFTTPSENYTYLKSNYDNKYGIYKNFWENYLNERYNKQNKIVTCYVYLTPQDYINFKWNNFIRINNQLFFVNKIYDYNIDENIPTKVDLITIQDLKGYTESNFRIFNIYFKNGNNYELYDKDWHYIDIDQHSSYTIYITSNVDIHWQTDSRLQTNVEVNGEVGYGIIPAGNKVPVVLFNDEYGPVEGYLEFSNGRDTQKIFVRVR